MSPRTRLRLLLFVTMVAVSGLCGALYALIFLAPNNISDFARPTLDGLVGGALFWSILLFGGATTLGRWFRRLSFPIRFVLFFAFVFTIVVATGTILGLLYNGVFDPAYALAPGWRLFGYVIVFSLLLLLVLQIIRMIGPRGHL